MATISCAPYEINEEILPDQLFSATAPCGALVEIRVVKLATGGASHAALILELQSWIDSMREISHPHIARLIDVKQDEQNIFLITESCEGITLRELIQNQQELVHPLVVYYMQQVASGLDYLHSVGIHHRDFTLRRVLIDPGGTAKIVDVGLPGILPEVVKQGGIEGPERGYISPEELQGQGPSTQADLFRFSVACFELITGVLPFTGDTPTALKSSILSNSRTLPAVRSRVMPAHLKKAFERALSPQPGKRPNSAAQLVKALTYTETFAAGRGLADLMSQNAPPKERKKAKAPPWLVASGLCLLVGVTLIAGTMGRSSPSIIKSGSDSSELPAVASENSPISPVRDRQTSAKKIFKLLPIAQKGTGGEQSLVPVLQALFKGTASTPTSSEEQQLLKALLAHDNPNIRRTVAQIIERREIKELTDQILPLLDDDEPGIRSAVVQTLRSTFAPVSIKLLALKAASESVPAIHADILALAEDHAAELRMQKGQ